MNYEKALEIGVGRSADAAELLATATGLMTQMVRAVKQIGSFGRREDPDAWAPVGEENFVDVAFFEHKEPSANALVLLVDEDGYTKASTRDFLPVKDALGIAKYLEFPVSTVKRSYLRQVLEAEDLTEQVRASTLRIDV